MEEAGTVGWKLLPVWGQTIAHGKFAMKKQTHIVTGIIFVMIKG